MEKRSLGLIETMGYTAATEAADAAAKSADVVFLGYEITLAGLVTVKFLGDVGAVQAAVAAGTAAAEKVGTVFASHVIPRLDDQISITPSAPAAPERPKKVQKEPEPSAESSDKPAGEPEGEPASPEVEVAVAAAERSPARRKSSPGKPGRKTSGSKGGSAGKKTRGKTGDRL
ncbi:MAG TPA: BMC domain-containing protein [Proteobacteria bacterium]|nr:BMC domain-containing protein [Pseudomonadota bacterium]